MSYYKKARKTGRSGKIRFVLPAGLRIQTGNSRFAQHGAPQTFRSEAIRWLIGQGLELEIKRRKQ
jgi:hypothetical protein